MINWIASTNKKSRFATAIAKRVGNLDTVKWTERIYLFMKELRRDWALVDKVKQPKLKIDELIIKSIWSVLDIVKMYGTNLNHQEIANQMNSLLNGIPTADYDIMKIEDITDSFENFDINMDEIEDIKLSSKFLEEREVYL